MGGSDTGDSKKTGNNFKVSGNRISLIRDLNTESPGDFLSRLVAKSTANGHYYIEVNSAWPSGSGRAVSRVRRSISEAPRSLKWVEWREKTAFRIKSPGRGQPSERRVFGQGWPVEPTRRDFTLSALAIWREGRILSGYMGVCRDLFETQAVCLSQPAIH